jgi:hypothetical protein
MTLNHKLDGFIHAIHKKTIWSDFFSVRMYDMCSSNFTLHFATIIYPWVSSINLNFIWWM